MPVVLDPAGLLVAAFMLAFIAEGTTEYLFAEPLTKLTSATWASTATKYISLLVGVALAFGFGLDVLRVVAPGLTPVAPWVGVILTGVLIGRGSNFLNDFVTRFFVKP